MNYLKKFFLLILPPIFTKIFKNSKYQYIHKYETYKAAKNASKTYYDKKGTEKFLNPNEAVAIGRFCLAPLLVLSFKKKKIQILDYGGGANPIYSYIENSIKKKNKYKCY